MREKASISVISCPARLKEAWPRHHPQTRPERDRVQIKETTAYLGSQLARRLVRAPRRRSTKSAPRAEDDGDLPALLRRLRGFGAREVRGQVVRDGRAEASAGGMEALAGPAGAAEGVVFVFEAGEELIERGVVGAVDVVR